MTVDGRVFLLWLALALCGASGAAAQDEWGDDDSDEESQAPEAQADQGGDDGDDGDEMAPDDAPADGGPPREKFPVRLLAGLKGGGGGNYLTAPSDPPSGVPFNDGTGGWGAMFGVTVQATVFEGLLGLEMGLLYDWGYSWSELSRSNVDIEWGYDFSTMRFPLLFEVGTPGKGSRVAFGTGPEFAFGGDATIKGDIKAAGAVDPDPQAGSGQASTFWVFNLGAEMQVHEFLVLTFDVHYALNLDTEDVYLDRLDANGFHEAKNGHEMRLLLGLSYAHDFAI